MIGDPKRPPGLHVANGANPVRSYIGWELATADQVAAALLANPELRLQVLGACPEYRDLVGTGCAQCGAIWSNDKQLNMLSDAVAGGRITFDPMRTSNPERSDRVSHQQAWGIAVQFKESVKFEILNRYIAQCEATERDAAESKEKHERVLRDIRSACKGARVTPDYDSGALLLAQELRADRESLSIKCVTLKRQQANALACAQELWDEGAERNGPASYCDIADRIRATLLGGGSDPAIEGEGQDVGAVAPTQAWVRCAYLFTGISGALANSEQCNLRIGHLGQHEMCGHPCPLLGDYCPQCGVNGTTPPVEDPPSPQPPKLGGPTDALLDELIGALRDTAHQLQLVSNTPSVTGGQALMMLAERIERRTKP